MGMLGDQHLLAIKVQGFDKPFAELGHEMERPTQEGHLTTDRSALCQPADRLVDDGLQHRGGNIFFRRAFVEQRLNIRFGEYSAARGNRVDGLVAFRQLVQACGVGTKQSGHMIDEGPCSAGADAVHPLFDGVAEVGDFGVLAPQFDGRIGRGQDGPDRVRAGDNLLDERQPVVLGNADPRRAGHHHGQEFLAKNILGFGNH